MKKTWNALSKILILSLILFTSCAKRVGMPVETIGADDFMVKKYGSIKGNEAKLLRLCLPTVGESNQILFPGDQVTVTIYEQLPASDVKRTEIKRIDDAGEIFLQPAGRIGLAGYNVRQAREEIQKTLSQYIVTPFCEFEVTKTERRVFVFGDVNSPGIQQLTSGLTLLDVIAKAGLKEHPYTWEVKVLRASFDGKITMVSVNLKDILKRGRIYHNIPMENNDIVFIPRRPVRDILDVLQDVGGLLPWYFFVSTSVK